MFDQNKRFVTESAQEVLEESLIRILWTMIDQIEEQWPTLNHIQQFDLYVMSQNGKQVQLVVHSQKNPDWKKAYILNDILQPLHLKSYWAVDNGEVSVLQPQNIELLDYYKNMNRTSEVN